jgi:hypothetical protein
MQRLDQDRSEQPGVINIEAAKSLSIQWEARFVEELDRDASGFAVWKQSHCSYRPEDLEHIRNDFVSWYMLVHPRTTKLEIAYQKEIEDHREEGQKGDSHSLTFLHLAYQLEIIRQPCIARK